MIDLLNGLVVHAKKGERQHYQPIQSKLTASSEPIQVVEALLSVYPFAQLYIADLNAIQKSDAHYPINYTQIQQLQQAFPQLKLWLDVGISQPKDLFIWQDLDARIVIGSENIPDMATYNVLMSSIHSPILSLDFMPHGYQGPPTLLNQTEHWPEDVIVMSLADVGAGSGPNITRLNAIKNKSAQTHAIAAGGIRDKTDLNKLKQMGIAGALVATALHQKTLCHDDIQEIMT